jgi:acyl carrier protein
VVVGSGLLVDLSARYRQCQLQKDVLTHLFCNLILLTVMLTVSTTTAPKTIEQQVVRIISKRKAIKVVRLRRTASLSRDLRFDDVDVVDIILELERNFHILVPDEIPFNTVGDFVRYVSAHAA